MDNDEAMIKYYQMYVDKVTEKVPQKWLNLL
jgi:hypothetical protein